jgi:2C-methyl-D-erythritol 2,4-cyclodiphosphate synthase
MNADVSLIAEAPKIGPHALEMRQAWRAFSAFRSTAAR